MNPEEPVVAPPLAPPVHAVVVPEASAFAGRVKVLGICFGVFAAYSLAMMLYFMVVAGSAGAAATHNAPPGSRAAEQSTAQMAGMMALLGILANTMRVVGFVLSLVAAIGLLGRHSWGRIATIIVSIPLLLFFPFGTVLAIYAIYLLVKGGAKENYALLSLRTAH
jgi:hypothetical protein